MPTLLRFRSIDVTLCAGVFNEEIRRKIRFLPALNGVTTGDVDMTSVIAFTHRRIEKGVAMNEIFGMIIGFAHSIATKHFTNGNVSEQRFVIWARDLMLTFFGGTPEFLIRFARD